MKPREIRELAGVSQMVTAVRAGVSEPTLRLYEAAPAAVRPDKRRALDAEYKRLAAEFGASLDRQQSASGAAA